MFKVRLISLVLVAALVTALAAGCTGTPAPTPAPAAPAATAAPAASTPAPAAATPAAPTPAAAPPAPAEPVKLKGAVTYSSLRPNMDTTSIIQYINEQCNVDLTMEMIKDAEKVNLMFASRDFPDFIMSVGMNAQQLTDAAEAGDLMALDDLLPQYAPTWDQFFKDNKLIYNQSLHTDGKLYSLPYAEFADYDRDLRDQWLITDAWLKELKLDMPTTIDEFTAVLQAFKDNAGVGSIPKEVAPFYYFFDNYIGGQMDVYGAFGVLVQNADYLTVDNGKVILQSINPAIKEPLKYLRDLYAKGLTPPEIFTDDWSTYLSKISSNPPVVGSYGSYANRLPAMQMPMAPLQSPNGQKPVMRRQAYVAGVLRAFAMFSKNPSPEATLAICELAVTGEGRMMINRGEKGVFWDYRSDGKAVDLFWEESPDLMSANAGKMGFHNSFIGIRDAKFYNDFFYEKGYDEERSRAWAFKNVYANALPPDGVVYVTKALDTDSENEAKQLGTDLTNLRKKVFADWIAGKGDIDAEWDKFVSDTQNLQAEKWLEIKQRGYDALMK